MERASFDPRSGDVSPDGPQLAGGGRAPSRNRPEIAAKFHIGAAEADLANATIRAPDGTITELRRQSVDVLRLLLAERGRIVGKDTINDAVWRDVAVTEDSLVQCVVDIRRALGSARDMLRTVPRQGYRLETQPAAAPESLPRWPPRHAAASLLGLAALMAAAMAWTGRAPSPAPDAGFDGPVVAVLPFDNLTGGARWDRLAQGLTQDVIADLARNPWLFVLADATTHGYADATPPEIAAGLGAGHIVDGSVQAEGGEVRISAALVDAESGRQVWSKDWQGAEGDILRLQREAALALSSELASNWSGPIAKLDLARARGAGTDDLTAYELARLGIEHGHRFTPEDFGKAAALFRQAVTLDPEYGDAWAYLAWAAPFLILPDTPPEDRRRLLADGDAAALEAVRVAPDLPKPTIEAAIVIGRTDAASAERMIRRAVALAPNNADILAYAAGQARWAPGIADAAEDWIRRAMALNPRHPAWYAWSLADVLWAQGRYAEAAAAFDRSPAFVDTQAMAAASWALAGDRTRARDALTRTLRSEPAFTIGWFRTVRLVDDSLWEPVARGLNLAGAPEPAEAPAGGAE